MSISNKPDKILAIVEERIRSHADHVDRRLQYMTTSLDVNIERFNKRLFELEALVKNLRLETTQLGNASGEGMYSKSKYGIFGWGGTD